MSKYQLIDVFTPAAPAKITFVERNSINNRLVRALEVPGNQVVIYGYSGSGKSTLLQNILFRVYEKQINTNCMKGMTFEQVILDAFDQLEEFYINEKTHNRKSSINLNTQADYKIIKAQIGAVYENSAGEKQVRLLPPQLTPQNLGRLLGEAGYCWVLEDFHKIEGQEKEKLAQLMKVFTNLSNQHSDLKIVALGAANTARDVVKYDNEMRKRISEIHVDLMNKEEIKEIIKKGCNALNIIIDEELQDEIADYSNGLAAICHKLCYLMCSSADITQTLEEPVKFDNGDLQKALSEYINDEEDTLREAFDRALKIKNIEVTLRILSNEPQTGSRIDDMLDSAKSKLYQITKKKLTEDLGHLINEEFGQLVKFDKNSERYSFIDPFYRTFSLAYLEQKDKYLSRNKVSNKDLLELFENALKAARASF